MGAKCYDCDKLCSDSQIDDTNDIIIKASEKFYKTCEWSDDDLFISKWIEQNSQSPLSKLKPLKHISEDKYFLGDWNHGVPKGNGLMYTPKRFILQGRFQNGMPNGFCKIESLENDYKYEGNMKNGRAQGEGIYIDNKNKIRFDGLWHNSNPKTGTKTYQKHKTISRIWLDNYMNPDNAKIIYKDQLEYDGKIHNKLLIPHGKGTTKFPSNLSKKTYKGHYFYGQIYGEGHLEWKDGSQYNGNFINGIKNGFGRYTYTSKKYYQGFWKNNLQQGPGTLYSQAGLPYGKGIWKNGQISQELVQSYYDQECKCQKIKFEKIMKQESRKIKEQYSTIQVQSQINSLQSEINTIRITLNSEDQSCQKLN